ncbi:MAG: DUF4416 family protein [Desulfobacteraceae bacterium]|nr:DUF4416 family protein [Desulfobacteraceae bacterium]
MSTPKAPLPAKLLVGFFMKDRDLFHELFPIIEEKLGKADIVSPWFDFDYTDYYEKEMGTKLFRRIIVFKDLIAQESLAKIKNITNSIEKVYKDNENRKVNIDPGYMLPSRFILATGKDYSHRIYIGEKIYADLTLIFKNGDFHTLDWTYPDYAARGMKDFLLKVRGKYLLDLAE